MSEMLNKLADSIKELSLKDAAELVKKLEEELGISASAGMMMAMPGAAGAEEAVEEQTEFELLLASAGSSKVPVMKAVRAITNKDLSGAKAFVDSASEATPSSLGTFSKEEADKHKKTLEEAGATVKLK